MTATGDEVASFRLAREIRRRLGPVPQAEAWPLVSIVVLNRNGAGLLRRLLAGLNERTDYPRFELIVVDNGSEDDSLDVLHRAEVSIPISILANSHNESFSDACNQGAALAAGELLLFLNNDTEPFEPGWLYELVACIRGCQAGAVAATLICPDEEHARSFRYGYGVQHRGLAFREEAEMIHPVLHGWEADPLDHRLGEDAARGAVAAACLLVDKRAFDRIGGFSHGYIYGAEDVDLSFKLRREGYAVLCSGRSALIHHPVSTRRAAPFAEERARKLANRRLLWERWGPQLRREYELDLLAGGRLWAEERSGEADDGTGVLKPTLPRAEVEALSFCFRATEPEYASAIESVMAELRRQGRRCLFLLGDRVEDSVGLNYDVAIHVRGSSRYLPKPAQLNLLWNVDQGESLSAIERSHYDLVISDTANLVTAAEGCAREIGFSSGLTVSTA